MAFSDPQSVNPGSGAVSLPRTGQGVDQGAFTSSDGVLKLSISHAYNVGRAGRTRRTIRIDRTKLTADPLAPTTNVVLSDSVYVVYDTPKQGFTAAESQSLILGLTTLLTAATNAATVKFGGGES
jgi:hypothetical protein